MEPVYRFDDQEKVVLKPQFFDLKEEVLTLFPVPENNAVGTNDLWDSITLLEFDNNRINYKPLKNKNLKISVGEVFTFQSFQMIPLLMHGKGAFYFLT